MDLSGKLVVISGITLFFSVICTVASLENEEIAYLSFFGFVISFALAIAAIVAS